MKTIFVVVAIVILTVYGPAQEREFKIGIQIPESLAITGDRPAKAKRFTCDRNVGADVDPSEERSDASISSIKDRRFEVGVWADHSSMEGDSSLLKLKRPENAAGFDWKPALIQSGIFMAIQHGFRFTEGKTRSELDGPFFKDWKASVKNLRGWDDGGKFFTNYVGHPLQGSITGRIFINNSPSARKHTFGRSKGYWTSRLKAMAWSAVWSTQFEIGPISEATLGNVGMKLAGDGRSKMTYGDLVMTPVGGTGFLIGEDIVDKYLLQNYLERKTRNMIVIKLLRSILTPMTGFANILRGHAPWWRDDRINSTRIDKRYVD